MDAVNFQNYIFQIWLRLGTLKRGSRGWFNAMAHRYMPEWSIAFLKRIYQRIRRTAKRDGQHA